MNRENIRLIGVTSADLHIRANEDGTESRTIEGYAIVFGQESVPMWKEKDKSVVEVIDRAAISAELLSRSDIKMTMYHDMGRLLARSSKGKGTLAYVLDERGVKFSFDAPRTSFGDEALELVRRGDIDGCSFMFTTRYNDRECVSRDVSDDKVVYTVREITGLYDFTLTPDPAYPQTECKARASAFEDDEEADRLTKVEDKAYKRQVAEMRECVKKDMYK